MARLFLAAVATLMVAGACSGGGPGPTVPASIGRPSTPALATPAASATGIVPAPSPSTTVPASTPAPILTPTPTDGGATAEPQQTFHGAPEVETLIPDQVGDITMEKTSFSGQEWFDSTTGGHPGATQLLNAFLAGIGASIDDVAAVGGSGFSDSSDAYVYVSALKISGVDSAALLNGTIQFAVDIIPLTNSGMSGTTTPITLGGKNATLVTAVLGGSVINQSYYYGVGDVVYRVSGDTEETIGAALALLP